MPASQPASIRTIRDGKPVPPPRFESRRNSDSASLLSVWLGAFELSSSRPTTPSWSERTNDERIYDLEEPVVAGSCCQEAREALERQISRKAIRTFAVLEMSLDRLFEKLNRLDERLQRIERHQQQTEQKAKG